MAENAPALLLRGKRKHGAFLAACAAATAGAGGLAEPVMPFDGDAAEGASSAFSHAPKRLRLMSVA